MTPLMQSKVLRVLQTKRFERVGGNETIESDVWIVAGGQTAIWRRWSAAPVQGRPVLSAQWVPITLAAPPRPRAAIIPLPPSSISS